MNTSYFCKLLQSLPLQAAAMLCQRSIQQGPSDDASKLGNGAPYKMALLATAVSLLHTVLMILIYDSEISNYQFRLNYSSVVMGGIDGISIWQIFLVNLIIPLVILDSWKTIKRDIKKYLILVFFVNFWSIAVFFVQDIFFFYISFEAKLDGFINCNNLLGSNPLFEMSV